MLTNLHIFSLDVEHQVSLPPRSSTSEIWTLKVIPLLMSSLLGSFSIIYCWANLCFLEKNIIKFWLKIGAAISILTVKNINFCQQKLSIWWYQCWKKIPKIESLLMRPWNPNTSRSQSPNSPNFVKKQMRTSWTFKKQRNVRVQERDHLS